MNETTDIQFGDTDRRVGDKWPTHRHKGRKRRHAHRKQGRCHSHLHEGKRKQQ